MRLRLPELLKARGLTAYALAKASRGRISESFAYELVANRGAFRALSPEQLDAFCEVLECTPGELLSLERPKRR